MDCKKFMEILNCLRINSVEACLSGTNAVKSSLSRSLAGGFSFSGIVPSICIRLGDRDKRLERTGWRHYAGADMNKHVMAVYGNTSLERGYCNECKTMALIRHGRYQCCDGLVGGEPTKFERISEPLNRRKTPTAAEKRRILTRQGSICFYCCTELGSTRFKHGVPFTVKTEWDHQLPFAYSQNNATENFVAACHVCNRIKSNHVFKTVEEARVYLADRRRKKGYDF